MKIILNKIIIEQVIEKDIKLFINKINKMKYKFDVVFNYKIKIQSVIIDLKNYI